MAFVDPTQQETPGPAVPAAQQAPVAAGGQGVGGATKAAATPGQNLPAQPSAQLSAYLNANQPQAAALGQNVAQTVGNQVNAAGAAINPAVNTYTGGLYTVPTDAAANAALSTSPSSLTPTQTTSVENELGASAAAPNSANTFETTPAYQNTAAGIQSAVEQANLWNAGNNVASLSTALAPFEGPNATSGDTTLDSLLLSQTPGAYGAIQSAVAPAANLQGELAAGTTSADTALQAAIAADTGATGAATGAAQNFATNLTAYLNNAVTTNQAAQNAQEGANSTIYADAQSGNLTAADAQAMGIPANQAAAWATAYNSLNPAILAENSLAMSPTRTIGPTGLTPLNLSSYLTQGAAGPTINAASVATPQNYSDVAAIQALLGQNSNVNLPINASTANLAGTGLGQNASDTFNSTGAASDLSPEEVAANTLLGNISAMASYDPYQTQAQANVGSQDTANTNQIIAYLQQLLGQQGTGITPPSGGGYTTNV